MSTNMAANCDKLWVVISTVYRNKSHELCNKQRCIYVNTDGEEDPPTSMILTPWMEWTCCSHPKNYCKWIINFISYLFMLWYECVSVNNNVPSAQMRSALGIVIRKLLTLLVEHEVWHDVRSLPTIRFFILKMTGDGDVQIYRIDIVRAIRTSSVHNSAGEQTDNSIQ